nr:nuclear pore complex protein NUP107 [Tanacetum cinerariifolium]
MERVLSRSREVKVKKYDGSSDVEKYNGSLDIVLTEKETHGRFLLGNNVSHDWFLLSYCNSFLSELARFEAGVTMEITRVEAWYSGSDGSLGNTATYILWGLSRSLILRSMQVSVFLMESGNAHESHDELIELVASSKLRSFTCLVKTNCSGHTFERQPSKSIEAVFKKDAKKGVFKNECERVNLMRGPILAVS